MSTCSSCSPIARPPLVRRLPGDRHERRCCPAAFRWVSLAELGELMKTYGIFEPVHEYLSRVLAEG